jgi:IS4 transposase
VQAIEKLQWYALRWNIETFHKILKSGCQAEQSKLRTAERLVNLLATFCIFKLAHLLADDDQSLDSTS